MKKLLILGSVFAVGMISLQSCKKEVVQESNTIKVIDNGAKIQNIEKSAFVNPFNYVGEIHNIVLKQAFLNTSYPTMTSRQKLIYIFEQVNIQLVAKGFGSQIVSSPSVNLVSGAINFPTFSEPEAYYNIQISGFSVIEKSKLQTLLTIFDSYTTNNNWATFNTSIKTLEVSISNDVSIVAKIKDKLLSAIALGKSSFQFWNSGDPIVPAARIKPWLADLGGFVSGFGGSIWANLNGGNWGNPITNGTALGTFASAVAKL